MRSAFITALLAAGAQAIQITGIAKGDKIDLSAGYTVTWSTVSSDPSTAHLFLVNMAGGHTPYSKDLGEVDLKKGSVSVKEAVTPQTAYQFNLQSVDPLNTGILAQSQQFEVVQGKEDTKASSSSAASSTPAAGSVTSSAAVSDATDAAATTFATATATGTGAAAANGTKTGTAATTAPTAGAAANKVGVLAALAGLVAAAAL